MSVPTLIETAEKLLVSPLVLNVDFLGTKVRAQLPSGYTLDIYYNATLQKYSYTIIKHDKRIIGWDNAPPSQTRKRLSAPFSHIRRQSSPV